MSAAHQIDAEERLGTPEDATPRARPERMTLAGRWATLEPLSGAHADALWPLAAATPESWTWLPAGPFRSEVGFRGFVRLASSSAEEVIWAVRPHDAAGEPGPAAGWLALLDAKPAHATVELGNVWFPPGLARSRAATEACFLLLGHAFDALNYLRVGWKCNALHAASRRAAERLGFRYEGTLRAHMIARGRRRDTSWYGMTAEEWPARRDAIATWLLPENFDAAGTALTSLRRAASEEE
jgi:RimJ/RimL family protein N-acetyltransferase